MAPTLEDEAVLAWKTAKKLQHHIVKQTEKLKNESFDGTSVSQLENITTELANLRMHCMHTLFVNFQYAVTEGVELVLWQMHISTNTEYRRILGRLKNNPHVVERRKVEKSYNAFLRTSVEFYKGYIQRLSALFDIRELKRVAQGVSNEVPQNFATDGMSPVPARLQALVLTSCHSTLIRIGDLSRYRTQARNRRSGGKSDYDTALTCYSLAHELVPDSGFAIHQIGIIHLQEGTSLDITYDFYRAWATNNPHPNAKHNLESHFNTARAGGPARGGRGAPPAAHEAFIMWFVRLHALFYKGNPKSSIHTELDQEVIHRLTIATKEPSFAPTIFKMTLVNIAAFYIASKSYKETGKEAASRSCQYILEFSTRFISKICETLDAEIKKALGVRDELLTDGGAANPILSPSVEAILPILRIQCIWVGAYMKDILTAADALGGTLPTMLKNLSDIFTLLAFEMYTRDNPASCPYLLPEDLEIRGLSSFSNDLIPVEYRPYCTEDGNLKPHRQIRGASSPDSLQEYTARMLDILRCAYALAEDSSVPIKVQVAEGFLKFQYHEPDESEPIPVVEAVDQSPNEEAEVNGGNGDVKMHIPEEAAKVGEQPQQYESSIVPETSPNLHGPTIQIPRRNSENSEDIGLNHADMNVLNMLSPFLDYPSPKSEVTAGGEADETSYGMHSATANEMAQELLASFQPEQEMESNTAEEFWDPSIWNCKFPSPTLSRPQISTPALGNGTFSNHFVSNRSSIGSPSAMEISEDIPQMHGHRGMPIPQARRTSNMPTPAAVRASLSSLPEETHRNHLLQVFNSPTVPNASPSASWSQTSRGGPVRDLQAPESPNTLWDQRPPPPGLPLSSMGSVFTNQSSLYQGTPTNGAVYGFPTLAHAIPNPFQPHGTGCTQSQSQSQSHMNATNGQEQHRDAHYQPSSRTSGTQLSGRHLQMDRTASNYDQAILSAAWQGKK